MGTTTDRTTGNSPDSTPPSRRWWAVAGLVTIVASWVLLMLTSALALPALAALTILLFSWGVIGGIVNGLGLNRLPRATLVQIIAGFVLVFLGLWLGANEEPSAIFGGGLLVYPGVALVLNPLVVRLVRQSLQNRRTGR
ncbi:MAG: hypothetical protein ACTH1D_12870 [Mycobacteriaceae bacterium]|uniref:hypothetical protein n=1 Tax=Corynebacterium sp. TaxID=1720 RepID=UPI003F990640